MGWGLVDGRGAGVSEFFTINPNLDNNNKKKHFSWWGEGGRGDAHTNFPYCTLRNVKLPGISCMVPNY